MERLVSLCYTGCADMGFEHANCFFEISISMLHFDINIYWKLCQDEPNIYISKCDIKVKPKKHVPLNTANPSQVY